MAEPAKAALLARLEQLMQEVMEAHRATCRAKEAIDREKMLLEQEVSTEQQVIRELKINFDNSTQQLRRHLNSLYHDTRRELDTLRKEQAAWKQQ